MDEPKLPPKGRLLRPDPEAESEDPTLPAFLARPANAPVYHGFAVLEESRTPEGWCFGTITDPECLDGSECGDAYVVAPDNSRAGLIWHVGPEELGVSLPPDEKRWGVYTLGFPYPVWSRTELVVRLWRWLPELRRLHSEWAARLAVRGKTERRE
jgi:hypothetical protein